MKPTFDHLVKRIHKMFRDRYANEGAIPGFTQIFINEFIKEAMIWYSEAEVSQWLLSKGLPVDPMFKFIKPRDAFEKGKRVYLGDGTYMLNGVRFGEPKKDMRLTLKEELTILEGKDTKVH